MDDVSVLALVAGFFPFAVQQGVLGVLGALWVGVEAAAQQVETSGPVADRLEEEQTPGLASPKLREEGGGGGGGLTCGRVAQITAPTPTLGSSGIRMET